jgi:hypothetical protein
MSILKKSLAALLLAGSALLATSAAQADDWHGNDWHPDMQREWREGMPWRFEQHHWHPEQHPYYSHAMTDLRIARDLLSRPDQPRVEQGERRAVEAINQALHAMHDAAIDDGKDPFQRMPPDAGFQQDDRFHQALRLLDKARQDASHEEDDPYLRGLQHYIIGQIGMAQHAVNDAIGEALR